MPIGLARIVVVLLSSYLGIGLLFAVPFVLIGVERVDPAARGATWGFRVLILPGAAALWPLLLARLARRRDTPPEERNAHRVAARGEIPT
jgi:hypothetical protein